MREFYVRITYHWGRKFNERFRNHIHIRISPYFQKKWNLIPGHYRSDFQPPGFHANGESVCGHQGYRVRWCLSHPLLVLVRFSKLDCSTTKRVLILNDMSSESSRRDVSSADLFGTGTISSHRVCGDIDIDHGKSAAYTNNIMSVYLISIQLLIRV